MPVQKGFRCIDSYGDGFSLPDLDNGLLCALWSDNEYDFKHAPPINVYHRALSASIHLINHYYHESTVSTSVENAIYNTLQHVGIPFS